jgi:SPP1 gp7 family putative phage head morphogenesis protein
MALTEHQQNIVNMAKQIYGAEDQHVKLIDSLFKRTSRDIVTLVKAFLSDETAWQANAPREDIDMLMQDITEIESKANPIDAKAIGDIFGKMVYKSNKDVLLGQTAVKVAQLGSKQREQLEEHLHSVGDKTAKNVQKQVDKLSASGKVRFTVGKRPKKSTQSNEKLIQQTLTKNWSGELFSKRLWKDKKQLMNTLSDEITNGIISGSSTQDVARAIQQRMNTSYSNAERLARTETEYVMNNVHLGKYKANGYDKVEFIAVLDGRTSKICEKHNGSIVEISKAKIGVNIPPMHPNCRSTIAVYFGEE